MKLGELERKAAEQASATAEKSRRCSSLEGELAVCQEQLQAAVAAEQEASRCGIPKPA